jgi:plastocyanin
MSLLLRASAGYPLRPALAILFALLLAACTQAAAPAAPVATDQVDLPRSYRFAPEDITVPAGTEVTWTNHDNFTHSVRLLDSGEIQMMKPGESVSHTFTAPGLFRYDCSLHPKDMHGSVLVSGGGGQVPTTTAVDPEPPPSWSAR